MNHRFSGGALLLLGFLLVAPVAALLSGQGNDGEQSRGKEQKQPAKPNEATGTNEPKKTSSVHTGILDPSRIADDPAFDRYVDLAVLGQAISQFDAAALADVGLQLAEGERVLLRSHRGGITARTVLTKAAWLAAKKKDANTMDRVARGAEKTGDKELQARVASMRKLTGATRAPTAAVSIDDMTPAVFALLKNHWNDVLRAELLEHSEQLKAVGDRLQKSDNLPGAHKDALQKHIANLQDQLPKEQSDEARTLTKLSGASRDWDPLGNIFGPSPQIQAPESPRSHGLWFHNQTQNPIFVAVAYKTPGTSGMLNDGTSLEAPEPGAWFVQGWWRINQGQYVQVLSGDLADRYYYYYAKSGNLVWGGTDGYYNIQPVSAFRYRVNGPPQPGTTRQGFRVIDTGPTATGWTMTLN